MYADTAEIRKDVSGMARAPARVSISESVKDRLYLSTGAGGSQLFDADLSPYMIRPMDLLKSREYEAVVFVGPARCGKTAGLLAWIHYTIEIDPVDMMVLHMTQGTASQFSKREIRDLLKDNVQLHSKVSHRNNDNNTFDKYFRAGNVLYIGWPTASQGSGKTLTRVALTDYDRMPQDVDYKGTPFNLFKKRTETLMSRGMTYVETSPDFEILDQTWQPKTPHEAPPTIGALSLFNNGTRERFYYKCPHCGDWFITPWSPDGFSYTHQRDLSGHTLSENYGQVQLICSANGCLIDESYKRELNLGGMWVPDGCTIENGVVVGDPPKSKIASFWLHGCSAAYQRWDSIVGQLLQAERTYETTGSEEDLKNRWNLDMGAPYLSRAKQTSNSPKEIERRAEDVIKRQVPAGVRYLITSIDVQGGYFVVQVIGHGVAEERWLVDRYSIRQSQRKNDQGEFMPMAPGSYGEDWRIISERVIPKTYELMDGSGRSMGSRLVMCDSGGRDGTTGNAYDYWRLLRRPGIAAQFNRRTGALKSGKFILIKGDKKRRGMNEVGELRYPDTISSNRKYAVASGDVPLWLLNVNSIKDVLAVDLERSNPGPRYIHFPDWLGSDFYEELTAEVRDKGGKWATVRQGSRNEAIDLLAYDQAGNTIIGGHKINWASPPIWAAGWDNNSLVKATEPQVPGAQPKVTVRNRKKSVEVQQGSGGFGRDEWSI